MEFPRAWSAALRRAPLQLRPCRPIARVGHRPWAWGVQGSAESQTSKNTPSKTRKRPSPGLWAGREGRSSCIARSRWFVRPQGCKDLTQTSIASGLLVEGEGEGVPSRRCGWWVACCWADTSAARPIPYNPKNGQDNTFLEQHTTLRPLHAPRASWPAVWPAQRALTPPML